MDEQKIELRKIRDLSENLNDTFTFIRQNFKPLVTSFLAIAGIFMLANSIINGMYQGQAMGVAFRDIFHGERNVVRSPFWMINRTFFIGRTLQWINLIAMTTAITCYVKVYDRKEAQAPEIQEVWEEFKKYFLKVLVFSIPVSLLSVAGFFFCLIPGIYFSVVFTPFSIALILEDDYFGQAWNRCFAIIKNNFWNSLGIYLVIYIIYSFSALIISGIIGLMAGAVSYFTTRDISTAVGIFTSVLNIFSFVFYLVVYVAVILHYFNLSERHFGTGIMGRINKLGEGNDFTDTQEKY